MNNLRVITPPSQVFGSAKKILVVYPHSDLQHDLNQKLLNNDSEDIDIYVYDPIHDVDEDITWLLTSFHMADIVILDIDNCPPYSQVRDLFSYMVGFNKTRWLTKNDKPVYNHISQGRVYDMSFIDN